MGNCLGRKSSQRKKRFKSVLIENNFEHFHCQISADEDHGIHLESLNTSNDEDQKVENSPLSSYSETSLSMSHRSSSFSSEDRLILPSSSSSSSSIPPDYLHSVKSTREISFDHSWPQATLTFVLPMKSTDFHQHLKFEELFSLRSIVDDVVQEENLRFHHRSKTIFVECQQLEIENDDLFFSYLLVNATHFLVQQCFNEKSSFGWISQNHRDEIRFIQLSHPSDFNVHSSSFHFVVRLRSWPEEIRSTFEQRSRQWPSDTTNLFDRTCFIRRQTSSNSWNLTFVAIEAKLVQSMSDGQRRFATILWNYLNSQSNGTVPYRIYKHTLFYFFEQFFTSDIFRSLHLFLQFYFDCFRRQAFPHYFQSQRNLFNESLSIDWLKIHVTYADFKRHSILHQSKSLHRWIDLIEYQKKFFEAFRSCQSVTVETLVNLDPKHVSLGRLHQYQEKNVHLIIDYLPLLRQHESSLVIHSVWSMFIQYLNCLFDDLFLDEKINN